MALTLDQIKKLEYDDLVDMNGKYLIVKSFRIYKEYPNKYFIDCEDIDRIPILVDSILLNYTPFKKQDGIIFILF